MPSIHNEKNGRKILRLEQTSDNLIISTQLPRGDQENSCEIIRMDKHENFSLHRMLGKERIQYIKSLPKLYSVAQKFSEL